MASSVTPPSPSAAAAHAAPLCQAALCSSLGTNPPQTLFLHHRHQGEGEPPALGASLSSPRAEPLQSTSRTSASNAAMHGSSPQTAIPTLRAARIPGCLAHTKLLEQQTEQKQRTPLPTNTSIPGAAQPMPSFAYIRKRANACGSGLSPLDHMGSLHPTSAHRAHRLSLSRQKKCQHAAIWPQGSTPTGACLASQIP